MTPDNARLAICAHVHVLLRRKTGRVTDTEWMAKNAEYAAEIVRYCREQARERHLPELADWAQKLEQGMPPSAAAPAPAPVVPDDTPRYVGGLR